MKIYEVCPRCNGTGKMPSGPLLRVARQKAGKTIQDVADALQRSTTYISDLEKGSRNMTREIGEKYMDAIGLSRKEAAS